MNGTYTSSLGARARLYCFTSLTMPTIVIQCPPLSIETRCPIGSASPKWCLANDRFTIAAGVRSSASAAVNPRPRSSVMPIVWKYAGDASLKSARGRGWPTTSGRPSTRNGLVNQSGIDSSSGNATLSAAARTSGCRPIVSSSGS